MSEYKPLDVSSSFDLSAGISTSKDEYEIYNPEYDEWDGAEEGRDYIKNDDGSVSVYCKEFGLFIDESEIKEEDPSVYLRKTSNTPMENSITKFDNWLKSHDYAG